MAENLQYLVAVAALAEAPARGSRWLHRAKGMAVVVGDCCLIEATLTPAVVYRESYDGPAWCRPLKDFLDRFEEF
jgi:hypothetical protein